MTKKQFFTYFGISLSLVGVPLGMYFNYLFPFVKWSPVFMFTSVILIMSYKNLLLGKLPSYNKYFTLIFFFQSLMLLYGLFSDNMSSQYLSFHLYVIALVLALASNENKASYNKVILFTFYISGICTILGAFFMWKGLITGEEAWQLKQDNEDYALEAFTVATGAITNFICALTLQKKKNTVKIIVFLIIVLDIYIIAMSSKRTPVFVTLIIFLVYFYKTGKVNNDILIRFLKFFFLLLILGVCFYINFDFFQNFIDNFVVNFYNGVLNILGNTDVKDASGSAIQRYKFREWTYNYIDNNFNFLNYILGAGYMTRWIDNPLLQSYLDMGILGFLMYIWLIIIFPIRSYLKLNNLLALFAVLLTVYNIMATISSGNPYTYMKHIPVVFLAFAMNLKNKRIV